MHTLTARDGIAYLCAPLDVLEHVKPSKEKANCNEEPLRPNVAVIDGKITRLLRHRQRTADEQTCIYRVVISVKCTQGSCIPDIIVEKCLKYKAVSLHLPTTKAVNVPDIEKSHLVMVVKVGPPERRLRCRVWRWSGLGKQILCGPVDAP